MIMILKSFALSRYKLIMYAITMHRMHHSFLQKTVAWQTGITVHSVVPICHDYDTVKPVCNDHLHNKSNYLWFIQ